jgi:hypothetical protein
MKIGFRWRRRLKEELSKKKEFKEIAKRVRFIK